MYTFVVTLLALLACTLDVSASKLGQNIIQAPSERIFGGQDAERYQFPYQAAIFWSVPGYHQYRCSGTLISKRWVLSSAMCQISENIRLSTIKLGLLKINETDEDVQTFSVDQIIVHPEYPGGAGSDKYNIALFKLDRDAVLTKAVQIAKLATEDECNSISNTVFSGWGEISNKIYPDILQWALMPRITLKQCAEDLIKITGRADRLDETTICVGSNPGQHTTTCDGDHGGPLVLQESGALVGVVSWFIWPCDIPNAPSMFTRVCDYYDFINEHVKE